MKQSEVIDKYLLTLDTDIRDKVYEIKDVLQAVVTAYGLAGVCALALLGAEMSERGEDGTSL